MLGVHCCPRSPAAPHFIVSCREGRGRGQARGCLAHARDSSPHPLPLAVTSHLDPACNRPLSEMEPHERKAATARSGVCSSASFKSDPSTYTPSQVKFTPLSSTRTIYSHRKTSFTGFAYLVLCWTWILETRSFQRGYARRQGVLECGLQGLRLGATWLGNAHFLTGHWGSSLVTA